MALEGQYFEDFSPGKIYPTHRRTITETDLINFMSLCGFYESLFMDQGYVETETAFARRILPGALTIGVEIEVTEKRETQKPGRGIVTFRHRVINQKGERVLEYKVKRMIRRNSSTKIPEEKRL